MSFRYIDIVNISPPRRWLLYEVIAKKLEHIEEESEEGETMATQNSADICFVKVSIAGVVQPQAIVIQLDKQNCPKTCQNFLTLCTGSPNRAATTSKNSLPTYLGCEFHRIIPNFMVQTGDFENFNGTGGYCVLPGHGGNRKFDDEYLKGKHDRPGIISMANSGRNTNGSQFFITLKATPHLDGKHVVFGHVLSGMDVVQKMTTVERDHKDRPGPLQKIVICDCGIGDGMKHSVDDLDSSSSLSEKDDRHKPKYSSRKKERGKKKKKHKRHLHDSSREARMRSRKRDSSSSNNECSDASSENDSSSDRSRSRRKEKHRKKRRHRRRRRRHSDSSSDDDESASISSAHDRKRKHRHHHHRHHRKTEESKKRRQKHS